MKCFDSNLFTFIYLFIHMYIKIPNIRSNFGLKLSKYWRFYRNYRDIQDIYRVIQSCNTRHIHKISSVCKYFCCRATVMMMCMRAEFVSPLGRHGCHLQTIKQRLCIVLCVYNVQENVEARRMWNAVCNTFFKWKKYEAGWHSSTL
jgi:hypothetical protein